MWQPPEEQMKMLVGLSGKLFTIASTAAAFILDRKHIAPAERTAILLDRISPTDSKHPVSRVFDPCYWKQLLANTTSAMSAQVRCNHRWYHLESLGGPAFAATLLSRSKRLTKRNVIRRDIVDA